MPEPETPEPLVMAARRARTVDLDPVARIAAANAESDRATLCAVRADLTAFGIPTPTLDRMIAALTAHAAGIRSGDVEV